MDQERSKANRPGFFTPYSSGDPTLNVPVTAGQAGVMSPYMNFDPNYIKTGEAEFIFPEGADKQRGRFEVAFSQIGGAVLAGGLYGTLNATYLWKKHGQTDVTARIRYTDWANTVGKRAAFHGQALGTIAVLYSIIGIVVAKSTGVEGEVNILTSATATGALYRMADGHKKLLRGGAIGFGLASLFCLWKNTDKIRYMLDG
ncbi:mitochondrial import inner membrane translocase subunit Tim23-like [Ylistrum balloti]|uniref:mitochondrial import inner membrane translocase subunit Tim23-like n=1 Tax=Ylistrum balloti TaxID=509963 RepID=UPI002905ACF1|nr:mitochondrial import inner membrane translocase subunit Tim23-like [Ylistrum balloti]